MRSFLGNFALAYGTCCVTISVVVILASQFRSPGMLITMVLTFVSFGYACIRTGRQAPEMEELRRRVGELEAELARSKASAVE